MGWELKRARKESEGSADYGQFYRPPQASGTGFTDTGFTDEKRHQKIPG
jgi:hypothetical protein